MHKRTRTIELLLATALLLAACGAPAPASTSSSTPPPTTSGSSSASQSSSSDKPKLSELLEAQSQKNEPALDWTDPATREPYALVPTFQKRIQSLFYNSAYGLSLAGNGSWGIKGDYMFYTDFFCLPGSWDNKQTMELTFSLYSAYINYIPLSCYTAFCDSKLVTDYPNRLGTAFAIANGDTVLTYGISSQLPVVGGDQKLHTAIVDNMTRLAAGELKVDGLVYIEDDTKGAA